MSRSERIQFALILGLLAASLIVWVYVEFCALGGAR